MGKKGQMLGGMEEATNEGKASGKALGSLIDIGRKSGQGAIVPNSWTLTGTSTLSITLPVIGTHVWDPADYSPLTGILRSVALVGLVWQYFRINSQILRDSSV